MSSYIYSTLMLLEDAGLRVGYPSIQYVHLKEDGKKSLCICSSNKLGNRVSIENNHTLKLMILFTLLDFFIDKKHPNLAGKSFASKYKSLPHDCDYDKMLKTIFRIAKLMRNALVHNHEALSFSKDALNITYQFNKTDFNINLNDSALNNFYTAIVMYVKGDLGVGEYFLGIMRSLYNDMIQGITSYSDEFKELMVKINTGLFLLHGSRSIITIDSYNVKDEVISFPFYESDYPEWRGADFSIKHNGFSLLIPIEALSEKFSILEELALKNWKRGNQFPPLRNL
ncbi:hypothetical protein [Shewanella frigidimarina]|uniref:hypothetical protein n=1 Tax=Shewanella frigidimarina TaxID=56812 RepID=UPI003D790894